MLCFIQRYAMGIAMCFICFPLISEEAEKKPELTFQPNLVTIVSDDLEDGRSIFQISSETTASVEDALAVADSFAQITEVLAEKNHDFQIAAVIPELDIPRQENRKFRDWVRVVFDAIAKRLKSEGLPLIIRVASIATLKFGTFFLFPKESDVPLQALIPNLLLGVGVTAAFQIFNKEWGGVMTRSSKRKVLGVPVVSTALDLLLNSILFAGISLAKIAGGLARFEDFSNNANAIAVNSILTSIKFATFDSFLGWMREHALKKNPDQKSKDAVDKKLSIIRALAAGPMTYPEEMMLADRPGYYQHLIGGGVLSLQLTGTFILLKRELERAKGVFGRITSWFARDRRKKVPPCVKTHVISIVGKAFE